MMKQLVNTAAMLIALCSSMDARSQSPDSARIRKPQMNDTIRANVYADNSFLLYINGELVAVDWEGGIRVPLIVRGPNVRENSWCHVPVVGYDLLPTLCALAGVAAKELPSDVEGGDITSLLHNGGEGVVKRQHEELVFHFPHYQSDDGPHSAIRLGNLKLIHIYVDDRGALFDLSKDIGERNDLAHQMPKDARELKGRLDRYLTSIDAQLPTANPNYDHSQPVAPRNGGKNGKQGANKK